MVVNHAELPAHVQQVLSDAVRRIGKLEREKDRLLDAAIELLALKDGPRDEDYKRRKPGAWDDLRAAVAAVDNSTP